MNAFQKQLLLSDGRTLQEQALAGVTLCADMPRMVAAVKRDAEDAGFPLAPCRVSIADFERDMRDSH